MRLVFLAIVLLVGGCLIGEKHQIKVVVEVEPAKIKLDEAKEVSIRVNVQNIAKKELSVNVDAQNTEGLYIIEPERTTFSLKPEESRVLSFRAKLKEDALPGRYIVDVLVSTDTGEKVREKARLEVTQ